MYDAIVVGGGPAGLSAALVLGRCCRRVLVCDSGVYRNARSREAHSFFTRDGTPPAELLRIGREELAKYGVDLRMVGVTSACAKDRCFTVSLADGTALESRKLLLATGIRDRVPDVPGIDELYGKSVHHCPYCDGWEWRDQPLAVYGQKHHGYALAMNLRHWTDDLVLLTDGRPGPSRGRVAELKRYGIAVRTEPLARVEGRDGQLERIVFKSGEVLERSALFFSTEQEQCCTLPSQFGCLFNKKGTIETSLKCETNVPGLYVAGDASRDVQFVIVAASEGAKAAVAIHEALLEEDRKRTSEPRPKLSRLSRGSGHAR